MSARGWAAAGVLLALAGWWYWQRTSDAPGPPEARMPDAAGAASRAGRAGAVPCPSPPRAGSNAAPLQSPLPAGTPQWAVGDARLEPLAGFSIDARVLSRRDYRHDREAGYAPTDLALGWGRMREPAVLGRLRIDQRGRWYHYRWQGSPPIPSREIALSSANMHVIPADRDVADALARVRAGQRVRIDGWLVRLSAADGWTWRSSLTREDQGAGACELVYACAITPLPSGGR